MTARPSDLNSSGDITVPLSVNGAQRDSPEVGAELGQLRDVIGHLRQDSMETDGEPKPRRSDGLGLASTHLSRLLLQSGVVHSVDVMRELGEVRDDELFLERLRQQHDVVANAPAERTDRDVWYFESH